MEEVTINNTLRLEHADKEDSGVYVCTAESTAVPANQTTELNIRTRSKIISQAVQEVFVADREVTFDCLYQVDPALLGGLHVTCFKDGEDLHVIQAPEPPPVIGESHSTIPVLESPCASYDPAIDPRLYMLANSSLRICGVTESDIGEYYCAINTDFEQIITSNTSYLYIPNTLIIWIIIIVIIIVFLLLIIILALCVYRRRNRGKGFYGMNLEEGGNTSKSDIYYTTEGDEESTNDEKDDKDTEVAKKHGNIPVITPNIIEHLAKVNKSDDQNDSLLEDDFKTESWSNINITEEPV